MDILRSQNKNTDFLLILAWLCRFKYDNAREKYMNQIISVITPERNTLTRFSMWQRPREIREPHLQYANNWGKYAKQILSVITPEGNTWSRFSV